MLYAHLIVGRETTPTDSWWQIGLAPGGLARGVEKLARIFGPTRENFPMCPLPSRPAPRDLIPHFCPRPRFSLRPVAAPLWRVLLRASTPDYPCARRRRALPGGGAPFPTAARPSPVVACPSPAATPPPDDGTPLSSGGAPFQAAACPSTAASRPPQLQRTFPAAEPPSDPLATLANGESYITHVCACVLGVLVVHFSVPDLIQRFNCSGASIHAPAHEHLSDTSC